MIVSPTNPLRRAYSRGYSTSLTKIALRHDIEPIVELNLSEPGPQT